LIAADRSGFVGTNELFTPHEYAADPVISEWAVHNNVYYGAATAILIPTGDTVAVQVWRRAELPPFDPGQMDRLDAVRPHLARAGMLAARWRLEKIRAVAEALALIGLPSAVLDLTGRVLAANQLIQAMTEHVVWLPGDQLGFTDARATALFRNAIPGMVEPSNPGVRSFPVRGDVSGNAVVAHLIPTSQAGRDVFEGGFSVLVVTPVTAPAPETALIRGLFDLTPAEAKVARGIVAGLTTNEMAAEHHVTRETLRTQVKAVLSKIGVRRQVEATAKLAALPRFFRPE
jgi:DNA-binding CsgD family transcriptional regulator